LECHRRRSDTALWRLSTIDAARRSDGDMGQACPQTHLTESRVESSSKVLLGSLAPAPIEVTLCRRQLVGSLSGDADATAIQTAIEGVGYRVS